MATYTELFNLRNRPDLLAKVSVAVVVAANAIAENGSATAAQQAWANRAIDNPGAQAQKALYLLLAKNRAAAVAVIEGASDEAIQTAVDAVVPLLVEG